MIISFCGLIGSGKDTAADYLCNSHGFRRESFAGTLKDAVSMIFGWDRILLEGRTSKSREWREQVDPWWSERLDIPNLTPRYILQHWGTDLCRNHFHNDIWLASLENKLRKTQDDVVITDCRFENELMSLRNNGGQVVRIKRGDDPEWFSTAKNDMDQMPTKYPHIHPSEYSWVSSEFDDVIENNGTITDLYDKLKNLV